MASLVDRARAALAEGRLTVPPLGAGRTADRWAALLALAVDDVSLARLAEAHVDAVQILSEAGVTPPPGHLIGVWASEHPSAVASLAASDATSGEIVLAGSKAFCSGAGIVDSALVTVAAPEGTLLVLIPGSLLTPDRIDRSSWKVPALADVQTATVDLDGLTLGSDAVVGASDWYLDRPGFWTGAVGPAACWAGAAIGLVHHALEHAPGDPHSLAHLGAMVASDRALRSILDVAGHEQDASVPDAERSQRRALEVRHLVDAISADIEGHFARCLGPRALAFDGAAAERLQALSIYRRQCHGERDLAVLGELVRLRP